MAFEEFSGELDKPTGFVEFSGELDSGTATPAPVERGIIDRVKDFVSPEYKSVLETQAPTLQQEQANINQRLSLGAGPISKETAAKADLLRSGMLKEPATLPVQKAATGLAEQNAPTFAEISRNPEREAELVQQISRQQFAEENPLLGSAAAGAAGMLSGVINTPTVAADVFNKTVIDPFLQVAGFTPMQRVGNMFGTEYLAKAASDFTPAIGKKSMTAAWNRDEMAPWLMSKLAANSPQVAQQLIAAFVPPLRAGMLLGMSTTAAGQSFAQGDDSRVAMMKGAIEYGTEKLPLGVFDKVGDMFKGMPVPKQNAILALAGQRLLQAGTQVTANTLTNAIEETTAQFGGNVLDKYLQGKDIELTKGLAEAGVVGGLTGAMMTTPQVAATLGGANERPITPPDFEVSTAEAMARERGFLTPERPATQLTNFTPADSPTKAAGLVDVVVPVPVATPSITPSITPLEGVQINPETEQQFGLDKLRLGTTDVSTTGTAGPAVAGGGQPSSDLTAAGVGNAEPGGVSTVRGASATPSGLVPVAGATAPLGGATSQQPAALKQEWYGRRGDGYLTKPDAEQAIPGRQRMFPDLQWQVDQLPTGKYRLAGYETTTPQETTLGTQTTQAFQATQEGQQAASNRLAGAAPINVGQASGVQQVGDIGQLQAAETTAGGVESRGAATGAPVPKLNQTPISVIRLAVNEVKRVEGVEIAPVQKSELTEQQEASMQLSSLHDKTITFFDVVSGDQSKAPNGLVMGRKHIFIDSKSDDAPLVVAVHEVTHGLPDHIRIPLLKALRKLFKSGMEGEFKREFRYSDTQVDEEIGAMMAQSVASTKEFWSDLRDAMGNKDFAELAKIIISRLDAWIANVRGTYGQAFADKYITDVAEARRLLVEAHAQAMREQGAKPDASGSSEVMSSKRGVDGESKGGFVISDYSGETFKTQTSAEVKAGYANSLKNPVTLKDGSRLSGFTDPAKQTTFHGYDKNGEALTVRREYVNPDDIVSSRDSNKTAEKIRSNLKSLGEYKPFKSVSKDEAVIDGVMYSAKSRDLVKLPTIEFKDLIGKRVFGIKADLTDAGVSYTGIDGSQLEFPIEMMGGPNFVALPANVASNVVWAVRGGATLTKIMNAVNNSDYIIVHAMNGNSHLTNTTISQAYIQTVEAYLKDKRINAKNLRALDKIVRSPANKNSLPDFVGFESPNIIEYIDGLSFDKRGALAKMLEKKEAQAHGLPNLDRFRRETIDQEYAGYRQGDAMLVIEVDKKNPTVKLGEEGTKMHPSYPLGLRGKVVGKLAKGINYELIYRDYFENKVPTLGNKEAGAWYAFDRVLPVQEITPEIAASVSEGGYKAIKSARQAEALVALGGNEWLVSGKTKAEGGLSVQEFVDALAANEGAAALTMYTPEQVKAGIKDKSFSVYQLGDQGGDKGLQVFFGLKRGAPWYKDMIDGVSDNEVEIVSVTNNEIGAPGVGIPAIITKAIQENATILDAFAVKSKRFPDGFLPEMYGQFGFETIGVIPFDESFYDANQMADLKKFWADGGWKESDGYPDVVVMKWKGNDDERSTAIERYVREGQTSISVGAARLDGPTTADAHGQRNQPRGKQARARRGDRGQTGGDQGAGNAAPVVGRAYSGIQELASLSDGDIRNLGINPAKIAKLKQLIGGIQRSTRARPDEPAGRSSIGRDQGDAVKVEGAVHYGRSAGLSVLSGASSGTGIKGAEQQRLAQPGVDPRIKRRVYFYLPMEGGIPQAEIGLGANVYTANLSNLYDPSSGTRSLPTEANAFESAVLDAGFRGYINRSQGTAVVLNSDVPVKAVGRAEAQTILKRKPQVVAQKISTQESGNDLVRKPTEREMMDIIKVRPQLNTAAPSFKLEFGSARVAKAEADAANTVFKDAGSTFMFSKRSTGDIGQALQDRIDNDFANVSRRYALIDGAMGGKLLDTDLARELSPEYREDRTRAAEVHEASSDFIQKEFDRRMSKVNPDGSVLFMAGGGGAGKSSADTLIGQVKTEAEVIYDGTLSTYEKAKANIEKALNSQRIVDIAYVYREPIEALVNGVLKRATRSGRTVQIQALVKSHTKSQETVRQLMKDYEGNPDVNFFIIDNSNGADKAELTTIDNITPVILQGLKGRMQDATRQAYETGQINKAIFDATMAEGHDTGAEGGAIPQGRRLPSKTGPATGGQSESQLTQELTKLFSDLRDSRGLKLARAQERVENNPLSAEIKNVEENFYDIVGQLEENGLMKINCD